MTKRRVIILLLFPPFNRTIEIKTYLKNITYDFFEMEKKGVSMFPFVIMFVMIAGAIILFFFFGFAKNIKKQGDTVNDLEIVNLIEKNLDSFTLAENSYKNIPHNGLPPKAEISVSCLDNKKTRIKLKDSYRDTVKLIVAPTVLKEKQISAWTLA